MVLRVTYYTILCGCVKALIPEILVYWSDNYICGIQIPTIRLRTAFTVEMLWEGKKEWKSWDLYMSSWSLDSGLLVFKANKLYLKWKTTLFIFEYLWWRVALAGLCSQEPSPSICSVGLCSQPLTGFCVFHEFCHVPNTGLEDSFGFSIVVLTSEAERPLFPVYIFSHGLEFFYVVFFS